MTNPDDIIAMLYEVGGRRDSNSSRIVRRSDLDEPDHDEPRSEASARAAYRARIEARARRRGGDRG